RYLASESDPLAERYLFAYHITIENHGTQTVRLLRRHWIIQNAHQHIEEIEGEGVVGQTPYLRPGSSFSYTSFCPLATEWGSMRGSYLMQRVDHSTFSAAIPIFALLMFSHLN